MTQELTPNTQITQENVGLLPCPFCGGSASARTILRASVRCDECGAESRSFSMTVCGTDAAVSEAIAAWNRRPALSPPAEGSCGGPYSCIRCDNSTWNDDDICDACAKEARDMNDELDALEATPTPAPVDWERVGPKLVEALERIKANDPNDPAQPWNVARDALAAAAQPEGK